MKGGRRKKAGRAVLAVVLAAVAVSGVRLWRPGAGTGGNLPEGSYLREQTALACFLFCGAAITRRRERRWTSP